MIDALLHEVYDRKQNNCLHFAAKAWELLTGDVRLGRVKEPNVLGARTIMRGFKRVEGPTRTPSVVLMETSSGEVHIGVCKDRKLLHLCERGAEFLPFDCYTAVYFGMRFYQ